MVTAETGSPAGPDFSVEVVGCVSHVESDNLEGVPVERLVISEPSAYRAYRIWPGGPAAHMLQWSAILRRTGSMRRAEARAGGRSVCRILCLTDHPPSWKIKIAGLAYPHAVRSSLRMPAGQVVTAEQCQLVRRCAVTVGASLVRIALCRLADLSVQTGKLLPRVHEQSLG